MSTHQALSSALASLRERPALLPPPTTLLPPYSTGFAVLLKMASKPSCLNHDLIDALNEVQIHETYDILHENALNKLLDSIEQLSNTKDASQDQSTLLELVNKLTRVVDKQLEIQKQNLPHSQSNSSGSHSATLPIATSHILPQASESRLSGSSAEIAAPSSQLSTPRPSHPRIESITTASKSKGGEVTDRDNVHLPGIAESAKELSSQQPLKEKESFVSDHDQAEEDEGRKGDGQQKRSDEEIESSSSDGIITCQFKPRKGRSRKRRQQRAARLAEDKSHKVEASVGKRARRKSESEESSQEENTSSTVQLKNTRRYDRQEEEEDKEYVGQEGHVNHRVSSPQPQIPITSLDRNETSSKARSQLTAHNTRVIKNESRPVSHEGSKSSKKVGTSTSVVSKSKLSLPVPQKRSTFSSDEELLPSTKQQKKKKPSSKSSKKTRPLSDSESSSSSLEAVQKPKAYGQQTSSSKSVSGSSKKKVDAGKKKKPKAKGEESRKVVEEIVISDSD